MASQTLIGAPAITQPGKLLRIVTRCASVDEFITTFARFVDDNSIFVVMKTPRPIGPRQPFSMRLADGTPVLQGDVEVVESRPEGGESRPGMRIRFIELEAPSKALHARLRAAGDEAAARHTGERAATQAGDYGTVEDSGLRFPPTAPTSESLSSVLVPPTPAPPILPNVATSKGLPPPGPRSSALPMMPSSTLGAPLPTPALPQSVPALAPKLPEAPPPPAAPLPPAPIIAAPPPPTPAPPALPLTPIVSNPPLAPFATPVPQLGPTSKRASTATGAAQRAKRNTQNSGIERAWQDSPPNVDEGYADDADDGRRKQLITGVVTGVGGMLVGVLIGYLLFHHAAAPLAAAPAAAVPAASDLGAPPPAGEPPAAAARSEVPAAAPAPAPPVADGAACKATIHSTPPGADVTIAGARAGQTPLDDVTIACGDQDITLARPRYEPVTRSVSARADEPVRLDERLARPPAQLELVSVPAGASFTVDGAKSPAKSKLESYTNRTVTASLPGYKTMTKKIYLKGAKMRVSFKLERGSGSSKPPARKPPRKR